MIRDMKVHLVFCLLSGLCESGHGHAVEDLGEYRSLDFGRFSVSGRREVDFAGRGILEILHQKIAA